MAASCRAWRLSRSIDRKGCSCAPARRITSRGWCRNHGRECRRAARRIKARLRSATAPGWRFRRRRSVPRAAPVVTPAIVNALIGAASDPEPVVRAAALNGLGTIGDRERSLAPVLARLVDQSRVVRAKAAEVLVSFGIVELPGNAGAALKKAQEDYILSLEMFPDVASNHASRGWLEAERRPRRRSAHGAGRGDHGGTEVRVSVGGQGCAAGARREVRGGGGDVAEGSIDRAFLPQYRSADCRGAEEKTVIRDRGSVISGSPDPWAD